jgi:hypothetical protein
MSGFEREARAIAALNHPNICQIYDIGSDYLVMELLEGPTLKERIKAGALPLDEALRIAEQIALTRDSSPIATSNLTRSRSKTMAQSMSWTSASGASPPPLLSLSSPTGRPSCTSKRNDHAVMDMLEARVGFHLTELCSAAPDKRQAIARPGRLVQVVPCLFLLPKSAKPARRSALIDSLRL